MLVVRRVLPVERERVFAAWLDPASLATWMRPGETTDAIVEVDPRVGGRFRILMEQPEGGCGYEHRGEYLAIEPPSLLSFTWISAATDLRPTVVTVELHARDGGTGAGADAPAAVVGAGGWASLGLDRHPALAREGAGRGPLSGAASGARPARARDATHCRRTPRPITPERCPRAPVHRDRPAGAFSASR